ncbi:diguanylate cyclase [Mycobacterium sp. Y57]|uniref:sensor domain-containing diguanylate cyclase n=1 Tax=Mycolicibacterium xanthum TaxID=2796469 RepID=UPI001C84A03F|nr:diguanylate cyclase [Mycolicibacterium xanthum]MBX7432231.1 diguanylate cyclase [Mycolicibacterium xanthum]
MAMSAGGWPTRTGVVGLGRRLRHADLLPPFWQLAGWTTGVAATSYLVRWLASVDGRTFTVVWLAAAPQLVALLTSPRRHWPAYLVSFAVFQYVPAWLLLGQRPELAALSTVTAVVFAAAVLRSDQDWVFGRTDSLRSWRRFVLYGVVIAPAFAGLIGAAGVLVHQTAVDAHSLAMTALIWYLAEAVGIAFLTPVLLRWQRYWRRYSPRQFAISIGLAVLMVALGIAAAVESNFVLLFLTGVPALLVLIEFGIAAAFWQLAIGAAVILGTTFAGLGPFNANAATATQAMMHAQVFLLAGYAMVVMVAAALEERNRLSALDRASHEVYDLVAELTGDLVLVLDARGNVLHNAFAGHSNLDLPSDRITRAEWERHIHPDDLHLISNRMISGPAGPSLPFRVRTLDGSWNWFVVYLRAAGDGLTAAIMRDVTLEREVRDSLTDLANSDALTGLANRRGLTQRAREIWLRAHELEQPLTALFVDIDHFKGFNDHFGHQAGDSCLRDVADVLQHLAAPEECVPARYGGEEFAVLLAGCRDPYTFATGLASAIRALEIPHPDSPSGVVTISIGVARTDLRRAPRGTDPDVVVGSLLERADRALYVAKSKGRNRISMSPDERLLGQHVDQARERARQAARGGHDQ